MNDMMKAEIPNLDSDQEVIGGGQLFPEVSTGMSSYFIRYYSSRIK
jgi:hypothetical protein